MEWIAPHFPMTFLPLPLFLHRVAAGFPSPAEDYIERALDLNTLLIQHPTATHYLRVSGNSMQDANVNDGDILIVDRSLTAALGKMVIASINGKLVVKHLAKDEKGLYFRSANAAYPPIRLTGDEELVLWGVVTYAIHRT